MNAAPNASMVYYSKTLIVTVKSFITQIPDGSRVIKHFRIFIYFFIQASSRTWHDSWPARTSTGKLTPSPLQQPFQHKKTLTEYRDHRPHIHLYTYIYILPGTEVTSYTFIYTYNMYYRVPRSQATHSLSSFKSR